MGCSDCGKPVPGVKPPPITLSVAGFEAHAGMGQAEVPWSKVMRLPAFELFVAEQFPGTSPAQLERTDELFQRYCAWHRSKGQWPNETPLGELFEPGGMEV